MKLKKKVILKNFYYCELCDFGTFTIKSLNTHNETKKHIQSEIYNKLK